LTYSFGNRCRFLFIFVSDVTIKNKRQIDATDKQIDKLVYDLYGLTDEEVKIVETSNNKI